MAITLLTSVARAADLGALVGIVTDSSGAPLAHVTVSAVRADGSGVRATITGSDGMYSFADVPSGSWSLSVDVPGSAAASAVPLVVVAGKATRHDLALNAGHAPVATAAAVAAAGVPAAPAATSATSAAALAALVPEALQAPAPAPAVDTQTPFAVRRSRLDEWHRPRHDTDLRHQVLHARSPLRCRTTCRTSTTRSDHTIVGSTEEFRSGEFQIEQVSFGGNFHWDDVQARFLSMMGLYSVTTPRNDASLGVGQWDLQGAYKYLSEANAGYHWDVNHGLNVDAGIFVSYIGLFSYYNFDNWAYQPSFVSSNTPWFFNGLRVQWYPTQSLKIEPWLINGWQSYAKFNSHPGFGGQILWIPNDSLKLVFNSYAIGQDNLASGSGIPNNGGNPNAAIGQRQSRRAVRQLRARDACARGRQRGVEVLRREDTGGRSVPSRRWRCPSPQTSAASTAAECPARTGRTRRTSSA